MAPQEHDGMSASKQPRKQAAAAPGVVGQCNEIVARLVESEERKGFTHDAALLKVAHDAALLLIEEEARK